MRLVTFFNGTEYRAGAQLEDWIVDLRRAQNYLIRMGIFPTAQKSSRNLIPSSMLELIDHNAPFLEQARATLEQIQKTLPDGAKALAFENVLFQSDQIALSPPLINPGKIICVGMNYPAVDKAKDPFPEYPVLFLKPTSTLTGNGQAIILPRVSEMVLCEGELAVVIGRTGKHIDLEAAPFYVAGYTIANDVGARDLEQRTSQWATGKLSDTFCPIGPALITPDEIRDPNDLTIRTQINGALVQSGDTSEMFFSVPYLISYISSIATLLPGDILLTGSPKRLNEEPAPPVTLQPGDKISIEIEGIGILSNHTVSEGFPDA